MTTFQDRARMAASLEDPFIEAFNRECRTHQIVKFGVESTKLQALHPYIRYARDVTSRFVRYLPDAAIVRLSDNPNDTTPQTALIEFKVQETLIYADSFFHTIQEAYGDKEPPLTEKQDVFGVEYDSLYIQTQITRLNVKVVLVGFQRPREDHPLRAQYAEAIKVCQAQRPTARDTGSGTPIANTHFGSFEPIGAFFQREFYIDPAVLDSVIEAVTTSAG